MTANYQYACTHCRDCGVFPGTGAEWACCICEAGRLRCTFSSDAPEAMVSEVVPAKQTRRAVRKLESGSDAKRLLAEFRGYLPKRTPRRRQTANLH